MASKVYGLIEVSGIADELPVNILFFKQLSVQETLTIPAVKPDVEQVVSVIAEVVIKDTYLIASPAGASREGQVLSGQKLVVEGVLCQKVEYVAEEPTQSVHSAHFNVPFSTYIVVPPAWQPGDHIVVQGYIEDIYVQQLGKRKVFKNVTLLLDARREA